MKIPIDMIGAVIGPGGKVIKNIVQQTGAEVNIEDDGTVVIAAVTGESGDKAREMIERLVQMPEVGKSYKRDGKASDGFRRICRISSG